MGESLETSQFSGRVVVVLTSLPGVMSATVAVHCAVADLPESDAVEVIAVSVDRNPKNELPPLLSIVRLSSRWHLQMKPASTAELRWVTAPYNISH